jgi:hypothetical protein
MPATVYAMISSRSSDYYTLPAIKSFFKNTRLSPGDEFYLIDNDAVGSIVDDRVKIVANTEPQCFSKNINDIIRLAAGRDVVVLNNDIEFTPGWSEPLRGYSNSILIPSCNQTHVYASEDGSLQLQPSMILEEYSNNIYALADIVRQHRANVGLGMFETLLMPFYAFKLPAAVYTKVGLFDESYPKAGGEDVDYRLRAIQAGFGVKYVKQSYLLHFHGKSTWSGTEQTQDTQERNNQYFEIFSNTWGIELANLLLVGGNPQSIVDKYQLWSYIQNNDFTGMIKRMLWIRQGNSIVPMDQVSANGLLPYIQQLGDNLIGCELGVCLAFTLRYFFDQNAPVSKVYAVDAYQPYMDHWGMVTQEMVDRWKLQAQALLTPYQDRVTILEMDSISASEHMADGELDYIFIDGDHSYDAVCKDLRAYWSKVKQGGIFAGHDWNLPDVYRAVNDFRTEYGITTEIQFCEKNVWFWYK